MIPLFAALILIPYAPPGPPVDNLVSPLLAVPPVAGFAYKFLPNLRIASQGPLVVNIRDLSNVPLPPGPIVVTAPVMGPDRTGMRIGSAKDSILVYGLPMDLPSGALVRVTGDLTANRIFARTYSVYIATGLGYKQIDGRPPIPVPHPTPFSAEGLTGVVTWKMVPIVASLSATYEDLDGNKYTAEVEDRSAFVTDVGSITLTVVQGADAWVGEFQRVKE